MTNTGKSLKNIYPSKATAGRGLTVTDPVMHENVFYCLDCTIAITSPAETARCPVCRDTAEPIGWFQRVHLGDT